MEILTDASAGTESTGHGEQGNGEHEAQGGRRRGVVADLPRRSSRAGDAFDRLYDDYAARLRGLLRRYVGWELVDDLVQETFIQAYRARLHLERDDERATWNWLAAVARNRAIDVLRHRGMGIERTVEQETLLTITLPPGDGDPQVHLDECRRREGIADALGALGDRQRRILYRRHVEGRCYDEIARLEGVTVEAVRAALRRGRRTFREAYTSIAAQRGLSVVLGALVARAQARLRLMRDRVAAWPGDALTALGTASPAVGNAIFAAAVVGTVVVASAAPSGAGESDGNPPAETQQRSAADGADREDEPDAMTGALSAASRGSATAVATAASVATSPDPEPGPEPEPQPGPGGGGPTRHEASHGVDSEDVDPADQPHAKAKAQADSTTSADTDEGEASSEQQGQTEAVLDGVQTESEVTNFVSVDCPESDEETLVTGTVCSTLAAA